jgi:hypothetical protein
MMKQRLVCGGYLVDFNQLIPGDNVGNNGDKGQDDDKESDDKSFDQVLGSMDPWITQDVIQSIRKNPCFVAIKHVSQGCGQDDLMIWKSRKTQYHAVLRGIKVVSTKKKLQHILGEIMINGQRLHVVMYNDSHIPPFTLKMHALRDTMIPWPIPMKFKCITWCI